MGVGKIQEKPYLKETNRGVNPLTGLYENNTFLEKADEYISHIEPETYSLVAIDIEHFRLFNKIYGRDAGDELLVYIAECLRNIQETYHSVAGYFGGDNFCVLMPNELELIRELKHDIIRGVNKWNNSVGFLPTIGVYRIDDTTVESVMMYDRATIAQAQAIGNYSKRICWYDNSMEEQMEEEILLLSEIQLGLEREEFTFYAQPQCDISTGKIIGAESLVRWEHGEKGMISPGIFVPVLEKNGFIADLDRYVWRKVCEWLRSWMDRGYRPVPLSINVSRLDIFSMDVPAYLKELLRTYQLPAKLIKVEITESAYAESDKKITTVVNELQEAGFLVMMDDFGSGYSSLNMLKNVNVDVLKLDMRFLEINGQEEEKGINILESVVNMARQMRIPIIVEGVETKKQEKFLITLECRYTQGYYYYKPLPIDEFEELLSDERKLDYNGLCCEQIEGLHVREFLDNNLFSDAMVNNILGAAAFYDMYENQIEITRVNEQYYQLAGVNADEKTNYQEKLWNHVRDDDRAVLLSIFEHAYKNPAEGGQGYIHYVRTDGKVLWVYMRTFFLREKQGHRLFYSSLVDMTASHKKKSGRFYEHEVTELSEKQQSRMEKYYGDIPCGYGVARVVLDESHTPCNYEIIYVNHEMEDICGGDMSRLRGLILNLFEDNQSELLEKAYRAAFKGESVSHYVYSSVTGRYLKLTLYQYEYGHVACMMSDETHSYISEDALKGIMTSYREVYFIQLQDNYCRMIYPDENRLIERGNYEEIVNRHFGTGKILHHDEKNVRDFLSLEHLREALAKQDSIEYKYRRSAPGISDEWCLTSIAVSERENGVPKTAIMMIRSIDTLLEKEEESRRQHMAESLADMSDGFFIYRAMKGEKILYANPPVLKIYGCDTMDEFRELVDNSFRGMVHPDDLNRVEWEIENQIRNSEHGMDYIRYRIRRKDGEIRWIDDCGHLEDAGSGEDMKLFYVFITDITDTITEREQNKLLQMNHHYH